MHRHTALAFLAIALGVGLSFCTDQSRSIRTYYFPVEDLVAGKVYAYKAEVGDTTERRYWYYRTFVRDSGLFLTGVQYDRFFQINQIVREKIEPSGAIARQVLLYEIDTAVQKLAPVETVIESDDLFPFTVRDSLGVFLYRLMYRPPGDSSAEIYLIRNRRYLGEGPAFTFQGKTYPTIRFGLREAVGHRSEGEAEVEGSGEEWYAEGLGLVYFCKTFGQQNPIQIAFRLHEILSMKELEQRAAHFFEGGGEEKHSH